MPSLILPRAVLPAETRVATLAVLRQAHYDGVESVAAARSASPRGLAEAGWQLHALGSLTYQVPAAALDDSVGLSSIYDVVHRFCGRPW